MSLMCVCADRSCLRARQCHSEVLRDVRFSKKPDQLHLQLRTVLPSALTGSNEAWDMAVRICALSLALNSTLPSGAALLPYLDHLSIVEAGKIGWRAALNAVNKDIVEKRTTHRNAGLPKRLEHATRIVKCRASGEHGFRYFIMHQRPPRFCNFHLPATLRRSTHASLHAARTVQAAAAPAARAPAELARDPLALASQRPARQRATELKKEARAARLRKGDEALAAVRGGRFGRSFVSETAARLADTEAHLVQLKADLEGMRAASAAKDARIAALSSATPGGSGIGTFSYDALSAHPKAATLCPHFCLGVQTFALLAALYKLLVPETNDELGDMLMQYQSRNASVAFGAHARGKLPTVMTTTGAQTHNHQACQIKVQLAKKRGEAWLPTVETEAALLQRVLPTAPAAGTPGASTFAAAARFRNAYVQPPKSACGWAHIPGRVVAVLTPAAPHGACTLLVNIAECGSVEVSAADVQAYVRWFEEVRAEDGGPWRMQYARLRCGHVATLAEEADEEAALARVAAGFAAVAVGYAAVNAAECAIDAAEAAIRAAEITLPPRSVAPSRVRGATARPKQKRGRRPNIVGIDAFVFLLYVITTGSSLEAAGALFGVGALSTASRTFSTWARFIERRLLDLHPLPSARAVRIATPKNYYMLLHMDPDTTGPGPVLRYFLDATEFQSQKPSNVHANRTFFSTYKGRCTYKFLVALSPAGHIVWISDAYPGRISDRDITIHSGFLDILEPLDIVVVDKGFRILLDCARRHATILMPPVKRDHQKFTSEEEKLNRKIAIIRIHVERAMRRITACAMFLQKPVALDHRDIVTSVVRIAGFMSNFVRTPLVSTRGADRDEVRNES